MHGLGPCALIAKLQTEIFLMGKRKVEVGKGRNGPLKSVMPEKVPPRKKSSLLMKKLAKVMAEASLKAMIMNHAVDLGGISTGFEVASMRNRKIRKCPRAPPPLWQKMMSFLKIYIFLGSYLGIICYELC